MTTTIDETAGSARGLRGQAVRVLPMPLVLAVLLSQIDAAGTPADVRDGWFPRLPWEAAVHPLVTAAALPFLGRLGDRRGRRCVLLGALILLVAGAWLGALVRDPGTLLLLRMFEGVGAGGVTAVVVAFLADRVPSHEQAPYLGVLAAASALAMTGGPVVNSTLSDPLGRHWAVSALVPLGALALVLAVALPSAPRPSAVRADYRSAALLLAAVTALVRITTWDGTGHTPGTDGAVTLALSTAHRLVALFT